MVMFYQDSASLIVENNENQCLSICLNISRHFMRDIVFETSLASLVGKYHNRERESNKLIKSHLQW